MCQCAEEGRGGGRGVWGGDLAAICGARRVVGIRPHGAVVSGEVVKVDCVMISSSYCCCRSGGGYERYSEYHQLHYKNRGSEDQGI